MDGEPQVEVQQPPLLTMFQLTLKFNSTQEVSNNQLTTETTLTQHPMPGAMDLNSLIPTPVSVNGGKFNSTKDTPLTK
jgi:hypothetical protein